MVGVEDDGVDATGLLEEHEAEREEDGLPGDGRGEDVEEPRALALGDLVLETGHLPMDVVTFAPEPGEARGGLVRLALPQ